MEKNVGLVVNQRKGVKVKGGKRGNGSPCMTVMSLKEYFKNVSSTKHFEKPETHQTSNLSSTKRNF